jgi:hypothetical protein
MGCSSSYAATIAALSVLSTSFTEQVKHLIMEQVELIALDIEVRLRVPISTFPGIIVEDPSVGVEERALEPFAGLPFDAICLERIMCHKHLPAS